MASNPYIKSIIWLVSSGAVGYIILRLTTPSQEKLDAIKSSRSNLHMTAEEKQKLLFMKKLKEATEDPPVYLNKKKD